MPSAFLIYCLIHKAVEFPSGALGTPRMSRGQNSMTPVSFSVSMFTVDHFSGPG